MSSRSLEEKNSEAIESLSGKVDELLEQRKARKTRRLEKSRQHEAQLEELTKRLGEIAKQSGYELEPEDNEPATKAQFFIPQKFR